MRKWIKKYERSFMLGLVIFLLVIFTVAADFADALKPGGDSDEIDPRDVAGTFSLLPGETVEVSYEELDAARRQLGLYFTFQSGGRNNRVNDTEVWTYLKRRIKELGLDGAVQTAQGVSDEPCVHRSKVDCLRVCVAPSSKPMFDTRLCAGRMLSPFWVQMLNCQMKAHESILPAWT